MTITRKQTNHSFKMSSASVQTKKKKFKKIPNPKSEIRKGKQFRLFHFQTYDTKPEDEEGNVLYHKSKFCIQMFGIDETGTTCALFVEDMIPFFYIQVGILWGNRELVLFKKELQKKLGKSASGLLDVELIDKNKLYDFTGTNTFRFVKLSFQNMSVFNRVRNFWYETDRTEDGEYSRKYKQWIFENSELKLYESKIPPLLRYFHIQNVSPSGWVEVYDHLAKTPDVITTTCDYEFVCNMNHIKPLPQKENPVPYKIACFDIEASSSHGDFPVPIKNYKRLVSQIVDVFQYRVQMGTLDIRQNATTKMYLKKAISSAFGINGNCSDIDLVYPKQKIVKEDIKKKIEIYLQDAIVEIEKDRKNKEGKQHLKITTVFEKIAESAKAISKHNSGVDGADGGNGGEGDEDGGNSPVAEINGGFGSCVGELSSYTNYGGSMKYPKASNGQTAIDVLTDSEYTREQKIKILNDAMTTLFPPLKGDEITFIGTTFMKYGDSEPYKNHCLVVGSCDSVANAEIVSVNTESECLLEWAKLIQNENPDIVIGYNIFGFDYEFMFQRSRELGCVDGFTNLSRVMDETCYRKMADGSFALEQTKNRLASGDYDLHYPGMSGRLQIDLLFYFRRDYNLSSYKLDDVAGTFIRDDIKGIEFSTSDSDCAQKVTKLYSKNLSGLHVDDFIHIEITSFTVDYYGKGKKFKVVGIDRDVLVEEDRELVSKGKYNVIYIEGHYLDLNPKTQTLKWGMAKDDVTPQDIFRLSKESASSRAIVAKYCIQDCNLVHHLMKKTDVLTGYIEMSRICNVPISFLVFRGQGIKLTSYVAKVCREKDTLMPDLERVGNDDGYEGAIVLPPKCAMYGENPVACNDYSSLYPSIAKGWNLSPDSKVWTKTYDLQGNLIKINDIRVTPKNHSALLKRAEQYDNLPGYKYIYTEFDNFETVQRYTATGKPGRKDKVKSGKKVCRWAQFPDAQEGIIPNIIGDLLKARKETRVKAESEKDPFIANVLDKRQLGYKVTANSLYGQMGSSVSTFFEKDVAASITATGRKMITYAKRMVEEIYEDSLYQSENHGLVRTKSAYVYGDTDSVFFTFNFEDSESGAPIRGRKALELTIELAQESAHLCSLWLPPPMKLAYEKTLMSFILLSKKRYVGMLYETDPNKGKLKFMGLPLKRRDSCDYLKDVYGGILTILMKEPDNVQKAIEFLTQSLQNLIDGNVSMEKLAITKSLRSDYKNPAQIAHKVLADRIGERDPGNKPKPGDRIKFVFINTGDKKALLGERVETPEFIQQNKLQLDYTYYITNQLMNPLQQLFGLALEKIFSYKNKKPREFVEYRQTINRIWNEIEAENDLGEFMKLETFMKKREKYCSSHVKQLLFDPFLTEIYNKQNGVQTLFQFYTKKK